LTTDLHDRDDWFDHKRMNDSDAFQEHNKLMKAFYRSHPDIERMNAASYERLGILLNTRRLRLRPTTTDTGGSRLVNEIDDWPVLVAALEVAQPKFWQN
jgi:hypothetical protein